MQVDESKRKIVFPLIICGLSILLVILFFISLFVGRYSIPVKDVFGFVFGKSIPDISFRVIKFLRIPRTNIAILVGIALSVSGSAYQSAFNNKLVSPDLLGVSSGASVGACFAILLGLSSALISLFSFVAGFIAVILTVFISSLFKNKGNIVLLLSGIAIAGLMSSFVGLLKYMADNELKLAEMTYWLLGDISSSTYENVYVFAPIVLVFSTLMIVLSWKLNIVSLGEKESRTLGVNYKLMMFLTIVSATALTAGAVSVSGTIGWIGLVVPNIVRLIVGSDNRKVIPISILTGASFMLIVDMLARSLAPNEIPLSIITGIIGTPLFIVSLFMRRKEIK